MRALAPLAICLIVFVGDTAAAQGSLAWRQNAADHTRWEWMKLDPTQDRLYVAGGANYGGPDHAVEVVAFEASTGALVWKKVIETEGWDLFGTAILDSAAGALYVAAASVLPSAPGSDFTIHKFDTARGRLVWTRTLELDPNGGNVHAGIPAVLSLSQDGSRLAFMGPKRLEDTSFDVTLASLQTKTGAVESFTTMDFGYADGFLSSYFEMSPDGTMAVMAFSSEQQAYVAQLAVPSFELAWLQALPAPAESLEVARSLVVDWSRNLAYVSAFVTGSANLRVGAPIFSPSVTDFDALIASYGVGSGSLLWSRRLSGAQPGFDDSVGLALSEDGILLFHVGNYDGGLAGTSPAELAAGAVRSLSIGVSAFVLDGTLIWQKDYAHSAAPEGADFAVSVMTGNNGGLFITGWKQGDGTFESTDPTAIALRFEQTSGALTHQVESNDNLSPDHAELVESIQASDDERRLFLRVSVPPFRDGDAAHSSVLAFDVMGANP
jgi:outer membrane protein assembly factor BamB